MSEPTDVKDLHCPITQDIMQDPVIAEDGHTYERSAIARWIAENGTSPVTRQPLQMAQLQENKALKQRIDDYLAHHPQPTAPKEEQHSAHGTNSFIEPENIAVIQAVFNESDSDVSFAPFRWTAPLSADDTNRAYSLSTNAYPISYTPDARELSSNDRYFNSTPLHPSENNRNNHYHHSSDSRDTFHSDQFLPYIVSGRQSQHRNTQHLQITPVCVTTIGGPKERSHQQRSCVYSSTNQHASEQAINVEHPNRLATAENRWYQSIKACGSSWKRFLDQHSGCCVFFVLVIVAVSISVAVGVTSARR